MKKNEYNTLVNHNMLVCWLIIAIVLIVSYIIEIIKELRTIEYVVIFSLITLLPLIITYLVNKKYHGTNEYVKYFFAIGYLLFYTFTMITSNSELTFVYIIPMISILLVYCDKKLILGVFSYACLLNLGIIIYKYTNCLPCLFTRNLGEVLTFFEIQMACLILSGIFLYKTTNLLIIRKQILEELSNDIHQDALTNLYNIRFLEANRKILFNIKTQKNMEIAFIDIDDFKHFNTLYGHKFGDEVLISLAKIIKNNIENCEETYGIRVGGDEFVIISRSLSFTEFKELLERIRKEVENTRLDYNKKNVGICVSIGVSSKEKDKCETYLELYNLADARNGIAKEKGKNIIVF